MLTYKVYFISYEKVVIYFSCQGRDYPMSDRVQSSQLFTLTQTGTNKNNLKVHFDAKFRVFFPKLLVPTPGPLKNYVINKLSQIFPQASKN